MEDRIKCDCSKTIEQNEQLKLAQENDVFSIYGDLNKGETIIIKYCGKLLSSENSEKKIFINFGYGNLWTEKNVLEMKKCQHSEKDVYCASIELTQCDSLCFCFMDDAHNWDLQDNSSYQIEIGIPLTTMTKTDFALTIPEEEYMSGMSKFFKSFSENLLHFFAKIGSYFEKKLKVD